MSGSEPHRIIFDTDSAVFNDDAAALAMLLGPPRPGRGARSHGGRRQPHARFPRGPSTCCTCWSWWGRPTSRSISAPAPPSSTPPARAARQEAQWGPITFKGALDAGPDVRPPHGGRFAAVRPRPADAASFIIDTLERRPDEVTLVAVGPMTNLAAVFRARPDLAPRVRQVVFMGGNARVPGNVTPAAEFNLWFDPDAAAEVLRAGVPSLVMFGLDITNHAPVHKALFDRIVAAGTPLTRLMEHDMGPRYARDPAATYYVWDCITAAWLIDPSVVTVSESLPIAVETAFGPACGATSVRAPDDPAAQPVEVMLDLDVGAFYDLYAELLTTPLP